MKRLPGPGPNPPPQRARVTLHRVQGRQPAGAEAAAGLPEAGPVLHHGHQDLQPRGVGLGDGTVGSLPRGTPAWLPATPPPAPTAETGPPLTRREEAMEKARGRIRGSRSSR